MFFAISSFYDYFLLNDKIEKSVLPYYILYSDCILFFFYRQSFIIEFYLNYNWYFATYI